LHTGVVIARLGLWALKLGPWPWPARGDNPLLLVEQYVAARYPQLTQCTPDELAERHACIDDAVVVFDVRSAEEYAVSRLLGAIRVEPSIDAHTFASQFGERLTGRDVVFYCAIGLRSSRLAKRLEPVWSTVRPRSVANLSGGIFRWSNEERPLVAGQRVMHGVHRYSAFWSRFLAPGNDKSPPG
jgi:rhodanese-related sulfurtransferase